MLSAEVVVSKPIFLPSRSCSLRSSHACIFRQISPGTESRASFSTILRRPISSESSFRLSGVRKDLTNHCQRGSKIFPARVACRWYRFARRVRVYGGNVSSCGSKNRKYWRLPVLAWRFSYFPCFTKSLKRTTNFRFKGASNSTISKSLVALNASSACSSQSSQAAPPIRR